MRNVGVMNGEFKARAIGGRILAQNACSIRFVLQHQVRWRVFVGVTVDRTGQICLGAFALLTKGEGETTK